MAINGARPDDVYEDNQLARPDRDAKHLPKNIEQHYFRQTRTMGYRLKKAA